MHRGDAGQNIAWRTVVLICLAIMAAGFTAYSLIVDPPDSPPAPASYLP